MRDAGHHSGHGQNASASEQGDKQRCHDCPPRPGLRAEPVPNSGFMAKFVGRQSLYFCQTFNLRCEPNFGHLEQFPLSSAVKIRFKDAEPPRDFCDGRAGIFRFATPV
jgi:hypothetical protein